MLVSLFVDEREIERVGSEDSVGGGRRGEIENGRGTAKRDENNCHLKGRKTKESGWIWSIIKLLKNTPTGIIVKVL